MAHRIEKTAKAAVTPVRQRTQYSCMAASMCMCLRALGMRCTEDEVNEVMGARPMKGASWENALACGQHYGMRCTLVCPASVAQLVEWTTNGTPVMIAWNPEGREWSHASVVFDVVGDDVYIADPNCPDPTQTTRVVSKDEFYRKWFEKWPNYLVRRPALAVEREISADGRQVFASNEPSTRQALNDYVHAVTELEASADRVAAATNQLRALGVDLREEDYPFVEGIDAVASDICRWRGEVDRRFDAGDLVQVAHRVASRHASQVPARRGGRTFTRRPS